MATLKIPFLYGEGEIPVTCPEENVLAIVTPGAMPEAGNELEMVREAVRNPIGSRRLSKIASPGDTVAIVTDDHARPAVGWKILPAILEELKSAGVNDEDITIIMGSGTHRPCTQEEMERLVGREVLARYKVVNHDMDDKDNLVFMGMTSRGNAIWVNRIFAQANIKVLTGQIGIISFGFSGGRKSVLPAVAGRNSIYFNHRHEWITKANFGNIEQNVMHDDALEAAHLAKVDFIANVVLNLKHQVIKAVAGDMVLAWMEGVRFARELYTVPLERQPGDRHHLGRRQPGRQHAVPGAEGIPALLPGDEARGLHYPGGGLPGRCGRRGTGSLSADGVGGILQAHRGGGASSFHGGHPALRAGEGG